MSWTEALRGRLRRTDLRLARDLAAIFAPLVALVLCLQYAFSADELLELVDASAEDRLAALERELVETPGPAHLVGAQPEEAFELRDAAGRLLVAGGVPPEAGRVHPARRSLLDAVRLSSQDWRLYERVLPDGRRLSLRVGLARFARERAEVEEGTGVALAAGIALAGLAALFATRRALVPLRRATEAIERVDLDRLDARLPLRGSRDELDRHAAAVNRLLERLEAGFERIAAFGHDVAHELRTPLNRVLNAAEVALLDGKGEEDRESALETIRASAEEMSRTVEGLLLLAREGGGIAQGAPPVRLAAIFETLQDLYLPAFEERGVRLELCPSEGWVRADPALLLRAIGNLLDNALRHTPAAGAVRIDAGGAAAAGALWVRVSDSGPGVAEPEGAFRRFVSRGPQGARAGAGLGLPIARMIARALGGELALVDSPLGGAAFLLRLPACPPPP
jgi:two-component system heavy metal sensor histidine kinase CusS